MGAFIAGAGAQPALAWGPAEYSTPPIATWEGVEEFATADGALPDVWQGQRGAWGVRNGAAVPTSDTGDSFALYRAHRLGSEFEASTRVTLNNDTPGLWNGLVFNSDSKLANRYVFRIQPDSATRKAAWQVLQVTKASGQVVFASVTAPGAFAVGKEYTLSVRSAGLNGVVVSAVDASGKQMLTASTTVALDPAIRVLGEYAGVYTNYNGAAFQDFRLKTSDDRPAVFVDRFESAAPGLVGMWRQNGSATWGVESGRLRVLDRGGDRDDPFLTQQRVSLGSSFEVSADVLVDPDQPLPAGASVDPAYTLRSGITVNFMKDSFYALRLMVNKDGLKHWQFTKTVSRNGKSEESVVSKLPATSARFDFSATGWYHLSLVSPEPGVFTISITSPQGGPAPVSMTVKDGTGSAPLVGGSAGLWGKGGFHAFDNFVVASSDSRGANAVTAVSCVGLTSAETTAPLSVLTKGNRQYVAFYDAEGRMRVSQRDVKSTAAGNDCASAGTVWTKSKVLDGFHSSYDAHRSITMAFDRSGRLHVMGGWHNSALSGDPAGEVNADRSATGAYYLSGTNGEVSSLERKTTLVNWASDGSMTYPVFYTLPNGNLVLSRRDGQSGSGKLNFYTWNDGAASWSKGDDFNNLAKPGGGVASIYTSNVVRDADGVFHMAWVWRTGADRAEAVNGNQNSRVSYATTKDFVTWYSAAGVKLPTTLKADDTIALVDDVPARTGLMVPALSLDRDGSPLLTYTHHDKPGSGVAKIYASEFSSGTWRVHELTGTGVSGLDADANGTFSVDVGAGALVRHSDARYAVNYSENGSDGTLWIDTATWKTVGDTRHSMGLAWPGLTETGMYQQRAADLAGPDSEGRSHVLAWQAYKPNNDQPNGFPVKPQPLLVYSTTAG